MKQLKFMLAAATAVGIAAAAQADVVNQPVDSENFESYTTETPFASLPGFSYAGTTATDNESAIIAGGATTESAFALQVNTGTDPILRKLDTDNGLAVNLAADKFKKLYIDTMVQFTVTPEGDTVTATEGVDKLMIYLKEVPEVKNDDGEVTAVATTKLMVKAAKHTQMQSGRDYVDNFVATDVAVSAEGVTVAAGQWYRLVVTSYVENSITLFTITLNGVPLVAEEKMYFTDNTKTVFPSILGKTSQTLDCVGFAGEGKVDDIVITKDVEGETSVDFTLVSFDIDDGVKSVTYTIGENSVTIEADTTEAIQVKHGTKVEISAEAKDWFTLGDYSTSYTASADDVEKTITVSSKEVTSDDIDVTVPTGTPAATVNAALAWAKAAGKSTDAVEGAANIVANYLLNVENLEVEPKIKITSIDLSGDVPTVTAEVTAADGTTTIKTLTADNINAAASIKYKAAATLEALKNATPKAAVEAGDKFIQVVVE